MAVHALKTLFKIRDLDVPALQFRHQNFHQIPQFAGIVGDYELVGLHHQSYSQSCGAKESQEPQKVLKR